jgi:hypothetical protein
VKTKFDTLFAEEFEHFNTPLEEQQHVSVKLTREEALAIRGFLQGEGFEDNSWGGMRNQLNEFAHLAAAPVVAGGAAVGGATVAGGATVGGTTAAAATGGTAAATGGTAAATGGTASRAATLAKNPATQGATAGSLAGGGEDEPEEPSSSSGTGGSSSGPSSQGGSASPTNVNQADF